MVGQCVGRVKACFLWAVVLPGMLLNVAGCGGGGAGESAGTVAGAVSLLNVSPGYTRDEPRNATAYVRPHELELDRQPGQGGLLAKVLQVTPAGSLVRVRLLAEGYGVELNVDLVRERADVLQLRAGDQVSVRPRTARVFVPEPEPEYTI